jgi:hypothetical protein
MLVRFAKNAPAAPADTLTCVRPDGSTTVAAMPRQGVLPHDAIHFTVETTLGWHDAFFGAVARGLPLDRATDRLHSTNPEWKKHVQAFQCESLVECLQAEQWGGAADPAAFAEKLIATCRRRGVPPPEITADELHHVRTALREFGAAWRPLPAGGMLERTFGT